MNVESAQQVLQVEEYLCLSFEDYPPESETQGKGRHTGKRFRTLKCTAMNENGREHSYTLRIAKRDTPEQEAKVRLEAAQERLIKLQTQESPRNLAAYRDRLEKATSRADELERLYRKAKLQGEDAPADTVNVTDHGMTARQAQNDKDCKSESSGTRPSAPFIHFILEAGDATLNPVQWDIVADFLEGESETAPFFFVGPTWLSVMKRGGAVREDGSGNPLMDYQAFRATYLEFIKENAKAA